MLQEMSLKEALKKYISGRQVLVLQPPCKDAVLGNDDYMIDNMDRMFDGCRILVEIPATDNPDFKRAVQEMVEQAPPPQESDGADTGFATGAKKQASKCVGTGAKRKKIDTGKMFALRKAGWTQAKIADELGVSEATVCTYLKKGDKT